MIFFFGCAEGSAKMAFEELPYKFNIMVNYATKYRAIPKNRDLLFIDSGGYSFFFKNMDYSDPHIKYLQYVLNKGADFFANRDYPCEPELIRKNNTTVRENQIRTINNQIQIMDLIDSYFPELRDKFVAVIQGWEIDEYLWMLDYMKDHGLLTDLIGIGSVCRRNQDRQIRKIITTIRDNLPKKYKLHAFGVKMGVLKYKDVWDSLYSCDSLAYRYFIRKKDNVTIKDRIIKWVYMLNELQEKHNTTIPITSF